MVEYSPSRGHRDKRSRADRKRLVAKDDQNRLGRKAFRDQLGLPVRRLDYWRRKITSEVAETSGFIASVHESRLRATVSVVPWPHGGNSTMRFSPRQGAKPVSPIAAIAILLVFPHEAVADTSIGERPAVETHLNQADIDAGLVSFQELRKDGRLLFEARFNRLDGEGRPATTGTGSPRNPDQPGFIRTSAPDSNSFSGCHNQPASGGSGEFVANVFVLAQSRDPVTESISGEFSNERNTLGMFGSGPIEMLAREMSTELIATREDSIRAARRTGRAVTRRLTTKGVSFGSITVRPDGLVDPTKIAGIDWDLVVKPFHQKGAVVSLREFSNNAMNHHHGMQSTERFGEYVDSGMDGIINELTVGDITALTIFQASLPIPGVKYSKVPERRTAAKVTNSRQSRGPSICEPLKAAVGALRALSSRAA